MTVEGFRPRRAGWLVVAVLAGCALAIAGAGWHPAGARAATPEAVRALADIALVTGRDAVAPDVPREVDEPVPSEITAEVRAESAAPNARGSMVWRVTVRRSGHLVALRTAAARAAGEDWVSVRVEGAPNAAPSGEPMIWETTDPTTLETSRGLLRLVSDRGALSARLSMADTAPVVGRHAERRHVCEAHGDGSGGFIVLCAIDHEGRRVGVANVTDARPLEDAWTMAAEGRVRRGDHSRRSGRPGGTLVRLDLPLRPGQSAARVIGYVDGRVGIVVRAEASWLHAEPEPSLALVSGARAQPAGTGF